MSTTGTLPAWVVPIPLVVCLGMAALQTPPPRSDEPAAPRTVETQTSPSEKPKPPSGHQRMLRLLDQVAEEARKDNEYVGRAPVDDLHRQLDALPVGRPTAQRWYLHFMLGRHELRLGQTADAIEHYTQANEILRQVPGGPGSERLLTTVFELGVAYLRLGEDRNCVARHGRDACILPIRRGGVHADQEGARTAVMHFTEVLKTAEAGSRTALKARWLLNIAHMLLGQHPAKVPKAYRIAPEVFRSGEKFPRFTNVGARLFAGIEDLAGGAVVDDFDGDGFLDIMTSTSDPAGPLKFHHNEGDGSFSERAAAAGLAGIRGGLNLVHADYDNDGDVDVLVLRGGWWGERGRHPNSLLRNDGTGRFVDVTFEAGLGERHFPTQTAAWADYDNDGDLDLYVGNESGRTLSARCQLFRNDGDGTFTDVAVEAEVTNDRYTKGVAWGDYDGDRLPDLYVSNMGGENRLYRNDGDGTFTDVAGKLGVTGPLVSFATWFWDFDNDGVLDIFVAPYGGLDRGAVADVAADYLGLPTRAERAHLYRGDGQGGFDDVAPGLGVNRVTMPMGANLGDLDNDGFEDFYLGTGYTSYESLMPNLMFRNRRGRGFSDVTGSGGFGHLQKGHGVAFADVDNDGDQDVFEQLGGAYPGDAFGNALFRNPGFGNHWVKLALVGVRSNRSGVGARIRIDVTEGEERRSIHRQVGTGGSFGGNPLLQEIGLGQATSIDAIEVFWPATGARQTFRDLPVDRRIEITEGESEVRVSLPRRVRPG